MNREETKQRLIELGIAPEMVVGGVWDVRDANLSGADLSDVDLSYADLRGADLRGATLRKTNLRGCDLTYADLRGADLSGADLSGADLSWANLTDVDLSDAVLTGVDLSWADLRGADLSNANLTGANLRGAIGPFTTGFFGCDTAVAAGGYISIGTGRYTYEHWLEHYNVILRAGVYITYTPDEVADYGMWIKQAVTRQQRIEGVE